MRILLFCLPLFFCSCYVCNYSFKSNTLIDISTKINQDEVLRFTVDVNYHSQSDKLHLFLMPLQNFEIIDVSVKLESLETKLEQAFKYQDYNYLFTCSEFKKTIETSNYVQLKVIIKDKMTGKSQIKEYTLFKEKSCNFLFVLH